MKKPLSLAVLVSGAVLVTSALAAQPSAAAAAAFEAEAMSLPAPDGMVVADASASGGRALLIWSDGTASEALTTGAIGTIDVRARGDQCAGAPTMVLTVDGATLGSWSVASTGWAGYAAAVTLAAGSHTFAISFTNDFMGYGCDRNLYVDRVDLAAPTPPASPLAGISWYVDPNSNAARQAQAWRSTQPADAAEIEKIAAEPEADWFGGWSGNIEQAVAARVAAVDAAGATPLLVAYDIPLRDCGSYSSGGATSPSAYRSWIRGFAAGIGASPAVVILEPDALAGLDCLTAGEQSTRLALLDDAVSVLTAHPGVRVYLDAGNSAWHPAAVMASRLQAAGVARAAGFSLNVSNYFATGDETAYGDAISALTGGAHFVIDTSRDGLGPAPDGAWCNAGGRALGPRPTALTGAPLVDAYLWVKRPGESDGTCNGGPTAGSWWAEYALGLAQRARY